MSKLADNELFARTVQKHLADGGHYPGAIDGWAGPLTISSWRTSIGAAPVPASPIVVPVVQPGLPMAGHPSPATTYRLPAENPTAMNAFYGTANKAGSANDWFSFPDPQTRLYSRTGTLLTNRSGDERLDHKCHRLLIGRLTAALAEIYLVLGEAEYRRQGWHVYAGAFNYRNKMGGGGLSTHAWAIAIDFNPGENGWKKYSTTFSDLAIDIMERWGFLSGFRAWGHDAMHFQAAIPNLAKGSYYARTGLPKNIVRA